MTAKGLKVGIASSVPLHRVEIAAELPRDVRSAEGVRHAVAGKDKGMSRSQAAPLGGASCGPGKAKLTPSGDLDTIGRDVPSQCGQQVEAHARNAMESFEVSRPARRKGGLP